MLLLKLQCWCDCYQMMWVLGCLLVAVTDVGCSQLGLKRVGWLISHFEVSQQCLLLLLITQCLWLISSSHCFSDWSGGWPDLQLMSSYSQQSSELQLNSHVIGFDNFNDFPQSYWLINSQSYSIWLYSLRSVVLTNPPFKWVYSWLAADVDDLSSM